MASALAHSGFTIVLTPEEVNNLLQLLEGNLPLPPEMHSLHQYMLNHLPVRSLGPRNVLPTLESFTTQTSVRTPNPRTMLPTPEPSPTPPSFLSLSVAADMHTSTEQETQPSYGLTIRRRNRSHSEGADDDCSLDPAAKRHKPTCYARDRGAEPEGDLEPGQTPPDNANVPPHAPDPDCNRGGRRLRVNVHNASHEHDPLRPEEGEEGREEDSDAGVQSVGRPGSGQWRSSDIPRISSSENPATIIALLASAHCQSSVHDPLGWLQDIAGQIQTPCAEDESLLSVAMRCKGVTSDDVCSNFLVMVTYMTLVCKCQSVRLKTGLSLKDIYNQEIRQHPGGTVAYRTFLEWNATGSKFIAVASGGSIYALILIAGLGLRVSIGSMVGTTHMDVANMLRSPRKGSPERKQITDHIVPTIARMRLKFPLSMSSMFSRTLIAKYVISKVVDCTDLSASDCFFDAVMQNTFEPRPRSRSVWRPCVVPVGDLTRALVQNLSNGSNSPYSLPLSDIEEDDVQHITIKTSYDPLSPENVHRKTPADRFINNAWTADQRLLAEAGERVTSIDHLRKRLAKLYHEGVKRSPDAYLRIPMSIIPNHHLDLRNKDGSLMAFVSTGLPSHIRASLEVNLLACLESSDLLEYRNTATHPGQSFQAMHLSWYNRHCTSGHEAPTDVQPWLLEKVGMRTNHGQVIPYISKDLQQHRRIYGSITMVFAELFEWVRSLMETYLQEEFEMLMEVTSSLPGNSMPPVAPFVSLVININVSTKGHRDRHDRHLCLVIPIGHFEGGALCLLENGLVLELRSGDIALFRSSEVTHFNLDYRGTRASLVFQTDKEFVAWIRDHNGWVDNATMHSFV